MSAPLIITGMHRSGTSLLARFIHASGIHLGDNLLGARPSNPYGHFEDVDILAFHRDMLLRESGHSMWVTDLPQPTDEDFHRARALLAARQHRAAWGWKEPRTTLFLDFWTTLLPDAQFLFVVRAPVAVLDSLSRREHTRFYQVRKHTRFLQAWLVYNRACLDFSRRHRERTMLVILEDVLQQPARFIALLAARLPGIAWDEAMFRSLYDPQALQQAPRLQRLVSPRALLSSQLLYRRLTDHADL